MKATIWHHPRCSKSRAALAILQEAGPDVAVVDYLRCPPTASELARLAARAGLSPIQLLRPDTPPLDKSVVFDKIAGNPSLLERPLVETAHGVVLARPPERVHELL